MLKKDQILKKSLKKFPSFNSSIDEIETGKMTLKKYKIDGEKPMPTKL